MEIMLQEPVGAVITLLICHHALESLASVLNPRESGTNVPEKTLDGLAPTITNGQAVFATR